MGSSVEINNYSDFIWTQNLTHTERTFFNISISQRKICGFNKILEEKFFAFKEFVDFGEKVNKDNNYNDFKSCKIVIENGANFENNLNTYKRDNKLFKCVWPQCRYSCKRKDYLKHNLSHSGGERFKCDFNGCKSSFKRKRNLKEHKKIHSAKSFVCVCLQCMLETKYKKKLNNTFIDSFRRKKI